MSTPQEGKKAPAIALPDQNGDPVKLSSFKGRRVLVYFYPKADTPGCTTQACGLRDIAGQIGDTVILGISPDKSPRAQEVRRQVRARVHAAQRRGPRRRRELRRVGREEELRQDVHGRPALGVPGRRRRQGRRRPGRRSAPRTRRPTCSRRSSRRRPSAAGGVRPEVVEVDELERRHVGALQHHRTGAPGLECLRPAGRAHAPLVAVAQAGEAVLRASASTGRCPTPSRTRGSRR